MILKDKTPVSSRSARIKAGEKQELDVAFYLRRAFKDNKKVLIINDFKFTHNGETAQIDHLVIYTYGLILIESKSIKGEVSINDLGEWTRSIRGRWTGMPSPIKQLEMQQMLLRELLFDYRSEILGKSLGFMQHSFGGRCWDNVCVVSSDAIIDRNSMPKDLSNQLVKSEFLIEQLHSIMKIKSSVGAVLTFDTRPEFTDEELDSVSRFLLTQTEPSGVKESSEALYQLHSNYPKKEIEAALPKLKCKVCESIEFTPQYGRYGYFIKCNKCSSNTAMKMPCFSCSSKNTKVKKKKEVYMLSCADCDSQTQLI